METREVGDDLFLASSGPGQIFHLNQIAAAIWRLLEEPMTQDELVALFAEAFPDQPRDRIEQDIAGFVADLLRRGLIDRTDDG